jgi:hypothetical protein
VQALRLEAMQANASISDPDWMAAVTQLHSCGLTEFTIDSSNLSGNITDTWGRLTNLTVLELCEWQQQRVEGGGAAARAPGHGQQVACRVVVHQHRHNSAVCVSQMHP